MIKNSNYVCEICEYEFKTKYNYDKHINRKNKCLKKNKSIDIPFLQSLDLNEDLSLSLLPLNLSTTNLISLDSTTISAPESNEIKFIDLFCGIGGFHQAMARFNNSKCVFACDIDSNCQTIYKKNYNIDVHSDIKKINASDIPDFDVLCGGFPCQSFSNAGNKKSFNDDRGTLFEDILRIAKVKKPSFMFLENVKHLRKIDDGKVFAHILDRINQTGYHVRDEETIFELSPNQFGIPQERKRLIFVCIRNDIYNKTHHENILSLSDNESRIKINIPNMELNINKIIETDTNITNKYKISTEIESVLNAWDEIIQKFEFGETLSPTILCHEFYNTYTETEFNNLATWKRDYITKNKYIYNKYKDDWDEWYEKYKDLLSKREIYAKLEWQTGKKKLNDSIWNYFIQLRQSGIRVKKAEYFPTLVAIVQTPIYAKEKRYITPRECARLQSFPDSFILHENDHIAYKQFGNAINVDVIYNVMKATFDAYGK